MDAPSYLPFAAISGLISLVLMLVVFTITTRAHPDSAWRDETFSSVLLALLTCSVPGAIGGLMAFAMHPAQELATVGAFWSLVSAATAAGSIVITMGLFRAAARQANRNRPAPHNVTPFTPRPSTPKPTKLAA